MEAAAPPPQDFGVTHGLDFARWITEIANLLAKTDAADPTVQVAFLEIAKSLERLRRYKKDLILGTFKQWLTVNESVVTSFPTAEIVAAPMVRLMDAAGIWSLGIDHRIDIANVEMLANILAHPEEPRPDPAAMKFVTVNPVKYIVVFAGEQQQQEPEVGMPTPEEGIAAGGAKVDKELFHQEADVLGALDDAFSGWGGEQSDPLKTASREMARKIEGVLPSLEKLAALDQKAPRDFLRGYFEKDFGELTRGKPAEEFLAAMGHVLRALPPEVQEKVFQRSFKKADRDDCVDALRGTSPDFRIGFLLERMKGMGSMKEVRDLATLVVAPGGEVQIVEHIAKKLLTPDLPPEDRANLQKMLNVFGFDPSRSERRRVVLFIGKPGTDFDNISKLLTKRGYGVLLWDGSDAGAGEGQEMQPDIAIVDAPAAGESGLAQIRKVAAASQKTAIIVFSEGAVDMTPFYDLGVSRTTVLQKPVPSDILLSFFEDRKSHTRVPSATSPGVSMRDSTSKYMKADLARAREIQERLVPKEVPQVAGAEIAMAYRPCNEVGGDYLDLFWVAPGKLGFVIADVSGKGVAAAMVMVMVRSVFRSVAAGAPTVRDTMIQVNRMLARDVKKGIFVSALYGIYDVDSHRLTVANGGHNPPVIWRSSTGVGEYCTVSGMALGLTERPSFDASIKEVTYDLESGDKFLLYTDGVTEAFAANGDMYGEERLLEVFKLQAKNPAQSLLDAVMLDIDKFVGKAPRSDDTTLLVLGRPVGSLIDAIG